MFWDDARPRHLHISFLQSPLCAFSQPSRLSNQLQPGFLPPSTLPFLHLQPRRRACPRLMHPFIVSVYTRAISIARLNNEPNKSWSNSLYTGCISRDSQWFGKNGGIGNIDHGQDESGKSAGINWEKHDSSYSLPHALTASPSRNRMILCLERGSHGLKYHSCPHSIIANS